MVRLIIDRLTNRITGYEYVNEFLEVYKDDVLIDDFSINGNIIGAYYDYENKKIVVNNTRNDYHSKIESLQRELYKLSNRIANKDSRTIQSLLDGTLESTRDEIQRVENEIKILNDKLLMITQEHQEQCQKLYLKDNKNLDATVSPEYYSSVCLLIKDETQYLREWADHYLEIGFEHIYIYDNGSKIPVRNAVKEWYSPEILSKITVIDFAEHYEDLQTECYNHFLQNYGAQTRWVLFADSDEFLRIVNGDDINSFLQTKEDYTVIHVDFIEYGADGQVNQEDKPVQERFTTPVSVNDGIYYKDIIQPVRISRMRTHYPIYNKSKNLQFEKDKNSIVVDHYYTKSWEEWKNKMERGSCDPNYLKHLNEFFLYNPDMAYLKENDVMQGYHAG